MANKRAITIYTRNYNFYKTFNESKRIIPFRKIKRFYDFTIENSINWNSLLAMFIILKK